MNELRQQLQDAADSGADDHLVFRIGTPKGELPGPPFGGSRFPVAALLAGKEYARFHIDAGFGDAVIGEPEALVGDDFFDFAGLPPAKAIAIPKTQQFAEKIHAYTYPWTDRENTRVKDLVDLVILIARGDLDAERVRIAVVATFSTRATHPAPSELPDAPSGWASNFASLAEEAGLDLPDVEAAAERVRRFWDAVMATGA